MPARDAYHSPWIEARSWARAEAVDIDHSDTRLFVNQS